MVKLNFSAMQQLERSAARAMQRLDNVQAMLNGVDERQGRIINSAERMSAALHTTLHHIDTSGARLQIRLEQIDRMIQMFDRAPASSPPAPAASPAPNVSITLNTPNAESVRRSEGQITALMARAVARGRQGL